MQLSPSLSGELVVQGKYAFRITHQGKHEKADQYRLKIKIPEAYPKGYPAIWEEDERIPRKDEFHINPDGSLCLGSPLRLIKALHDNPCFNSFVQDYLDPYLYAVTRKIQDGVDLPFGELDHGVMGELADYCKIFGLREPAQALAVLESLKYRKRIANKKTCPCRCGQRLGACQLHYKVNEFRKVMARGSYAEMLQNLTSQLSHERQIP